MNLAHLTINNNDLRMSPRAEVSDEAIAALAPWARTNEVSTLPGGLSIAASSVHFGKAGGAILSIYPTADHSPMVDPGSLLVWAMLVWSPIMEGEHWLHVVNTARGNRIIAPRLNKPTSLPWLAAAILPTPVGVPLYTIYALGDLERCWAWSVLEKL